MKSATYPKYGPPNILQLSDLPIPQPNQKQVLVKVKSSAVNPVDWKIRAGKLRLLTGFNFPKQIGADYSGIVESSNLSYYQPGDEVYGMGSPVTGGAHGQYLLVKEHQICAKPSNLNFNEAASMPLAGLTALQILKYKGAIQPGYQVLINACTGGVGHFAVQYAKAKKAIVTGICSTAKMPIAHELGADHVIDYKKNNIYQHLEKYDIVLDTIGNLSYSKLKNYLTADAVMIAFKPGISEISALLTNPFTSRKLKLFLTRSNHDDLLELKNLAENGDIRPRIARIFPLSKVAEAHQMSEEGHAAGKIVVQIEDN